jgi:hypothetical protein
MADLATGQDDAGLDFGGSFRDLHNGALGPGLSPRLLGALFGDELPPQVAARVDEIPSAASPGERRFLLRFAMELWDGRRDVFENGPLLGSTTRALALGMLVSDRRAPEARLHTYDWFSSRVPLDLPPGTFEHLAKTGLVGLGELAEMEATGSFKVPYDALHSGQDYSELVVSHVGYLPGYPGDEPEHGEAVFSLEDDQRFSLVFIDGCKSWHGTKHWLMEICERVESGSHFIFQDYGWYTCFWLPCLVGLLRDHFRLVAHIDDTYAFELRRPLTKDLVRERYPDMATDLDRDAFDDIFMRLGVEAGERSDMHSVVALTIQHAGALATLGHKEEAREHIAAMLGRAELFAFRNRFILPALRSPTYGPDGPVLL